MSCGGCHLNRRRGFDRYLASTDGALVRLAASIRGLDVTGPGDALLTTAARALGRVRIALDLPYLASRSRLPLWPGALGYDYDPQDAAGRSAEGAQAVRELVARRTGRSYQCSPRQLRELTGG